MQLYRTRDGWIFVMCMTEKFWHALLARTRPPGPRPRIRAFATHAKRGAAHRDRLTSVLDAAFARATRRRSGWSACAGQLPVAPVYDLAEALDNPFVARIGMLQNTPHPHKPDLRTLANPIKLDGQRPSARTGSALGADTDAVLGELGYSHDALARLRADGVI